MSVRQAVEDHLGSRQVTRVVYGAIIGLALVVGLEAHPPPPGAVIATILGTAVAVGLADVYSEVLGTETRTRRRVDRRGFAHITEDVVFVGFGIAFPAVFFVLAVAGVMEPETAFSVAKWTGLGLIGFYGFCAARLSGAGMVVSLAHAAAVAVIGGVLIGLKALVH